MGYHGFDLVYELQVELGWEKEFATAARREYMRYLQLRAKAQDFQACKLTPSRVIAIVWNLHRQWTADYENTCTALGGYIHHYPPAMRLGLTSEQAYSNTVEMYKNHFNENPPDSYWGVPICSNKAASSNVGYLGPFTVVDNANAHPSTQPPAKNRRRAPQGQNIRGDIPMSDAHTQGVGAIASHNNPEAKVQKPKRAPGVCRVRHGYVLRPLPPGEKRKRGRPSMSEYIPVAQAASQMHEFGGNAAATGQMKPSMSATVSVPGRGSAAMLKSRRQQPKSHSGVMGTHEVNGQTSGDLAGAPYTLKRPRGRPRKDGSWPIPRSRPQSALKQKVEPMTSAEMQMPSTSEAQTIGTHSMGLAENTVQHPQDGSGVLMTKNDGNAGVGDNEMMDINEHVQKQPEFVATPQVSAPHFASHAQVPTGAPQLMDNDRDSAAA